MAINTRGPFLMVNHVAPHMIEAPQRQDHQHRLGRRLQGRAAHAALRHLEGRHPRLHARAVARARQYGIAVNSLSPGYILSDTGLENTAHVEEERIPVRNSRAFKRDAYPEDLLGALVFLASSDSDFVTGQSLVVDGGAVNSRRATA